MIITNSFSLNMFGMGDNHEVSFSKISKEEASRMLKADGEIKSAIGHEDTAKIVSEMLKIELPEKRCDVSLRPCNPIIVAQYTGPRLPLGTTALPEGSKIEFWVVYENRPVDIFGGEPKGV